MPRRATLRVTVSDGRGRPVRAPGLAAWLERLLSPAARGEAALAIASDTTVRRLNRTYRGIDRVTDVLSFPAGEPAEPGAAAPRFLGDVIIARGVAARQARAAGHSTATELRVLGLHGLLHLLGYDHERDEGQMARLEQRLRRRGGLRASLIEREHGR
jgi:probable rRNA maturation factor